MEAKRKAELLERRGGISKLKQAPKFDEFVKTFLEWSKQQHRPKTHELHSGNCATLKRFFRGKWLDEIGHGMVEDFKLARAREKRWGDEKGSAVSAVTVNRALSTLRLLFHYAERCGFQVINPVKNVEFFRETGRTRTITLEEERAYLATASQPLRDIARVMLDAGMRPEEVFRIEIANVNLDQRTIFNPFGKTAAAKRKLTMTAEVCDIVTRRIANSTGRFVFASPDDLGRPIASVRKAHDAGQKLVQGLGCTICATRTRQGQ